MDNAHNPMIIWNLSSTMLDTFEEAFVDYSNDKNKATIAYNMHEH